MLFTTGSFVLFASLTLLLYFTVPSRLQWWVLLGASLVFYALSGAEYLVFILYTATLTYVISRLLQKKADAEDSYVDAHREEMDKAQRKAYRADGKKKRFRLLVLGLILGLGMLAVLKYTAFVLGVASDIAVSFGGEGLAIPSLLLPLGISFYTFQSMGYLIDVYRKKARAETHYGKLLLFVSFFPQLLQGPISRFDSLHEQLITPHRFDGSSFRAGFLRVMWGYFKKLLMADTAMIGIKLLIESPEQYRGIYVFLLILLYSAQIYGDFTGGIDITIGLSEMMGIKLTENFNRPFSSKSTKEYWNRWHITMGAWFTDYVFYPLSVCRPMQRFSSFSVKRMGRAIGLRLPVYLATVVTWFLTGLWHGAGWNFIVWGLLNCLVILVSRELEPLYRVFHKRFPRLGSSGVWGAWCAVRTFLLMGLIRSLDCYRDVPTTFSQWASMVTVPNIGELFSGGLISFGLSFFDYGVILASAVTVFFVSRAGKDVPLRHRIADKPVLWCALVALLFSVVLIFGAYGIGYDASQFIYSQF
ncbi:MAG: MBOAT family protein [Ruminococcaceae bacterium]|nr:MBOAT family protein [Oscillospiraceae bacterium]